MRVPVGACALLVVALTCVWAIPATWGAPAAGRGLNASITATPSSGNTPLLVSFVAHVTPGNASGFNWTFGDGSSLSGGSQDSAPSHVYDRAGTYNVSVRIVEGNQSATATTLVQAFSGPLRVLPAASPTAGSVPLTVHFSASVTGGTETYLALVWNFGDGDRGSGADVNYTYTVAGRYLGGFTVVDSSQRSATAPFWVNISGPGDARAPSWYSFVTSPGGAFAIAVAFSVAGVLLFRSLSRPTARDPPAGAAREPAPAMGAELAPDIAGPMAPLAPAAPATASPAAVERAPVDSLKGSERVLLHLLSQGRVGADLVARPSMTQAGLVEALAIPQNSLTHILARLVAGGLLSEERRHVTNRARRLKAYQLTPRGETIARELRRRKESPPPRKGPDLGG